MYTDLDFCLKKIAEIFEEAVIMRLDADRPFGCLLSGGLDSSLIAAVAARHLHKKGTKLKTFSIGMPGGEDEKYAKMVAAHINSEHKHFEISEKDFINALPDIVRATGSYDITTVRASTGQFLISKHISSDPSTKSIKVLLCGDGSDEYMQGYIYFHKAPSPSEGHLECIRLMENIHLFDGLRADRCISHWGIEARFPFLDHLLVDFILKTDPNLRVPIKGIEKWLLRKSFSVLSDKLLPDLVLWRQKCAFSDGVSSRKKSWFEIIKEMAQEKYTDEEFENSKLKYTHLTPLTKESLFYREKFCEYYGNNETVAKTIPFFWLPKWCGDIKEPSARILEMCKG